MEGSTDSGLSAETLTDLRPSPASFAPPAKETVDAAIERSVGYLVRNCQENGKFHYIRHPDPVEDEKYTRSRKYNILRHAGTIYSLTQAHEWVVKSRRTHLLLDLENTIGRAARYLLQQVDDVPGLRGAKAVWSTADEEGNRECGRAVKLGGTGLGLLALVRAEAIRPGLVSDDVLQALGQFIFAMTLPHGAIIAKIDRFAQPLPVSSLYYPGEAALGLLVLASKIHNRHWTNAATAILSNLVRVGLLSRKYEADHWAVLAISSAGKLVNASTRNAFAIHAFNICEHIMQQQNATDGSFRLDHSVTPTAIRVEALLAFLSMLGDNPKNLLKKLKYGVILATKFILDRQQIGGVLDGGFPKKMIHKTNNQKDNQIRIDYVQHSLSAIISFCSSLKLM